MDKPDGIGSVKLVHVNIRIIGYKFHDLGVLMEELSPAVLAITEMWLISNTDDTPEPCGFICLSSDIFSGRKGGGVALCINNSLHVLSWKSEAHVSRTSEIAVKLALVQALTSVKCYVEVRIVSVMTLY